MFKLSYSCNSADLLPIEEVCEKLWIFGYSGVELSFQRDQFDPQNISPDRIRELADFFKESPMKPVCISTATTKFLSEVPHEPSLINNDPNTRSMRSELITKGIQLAEEIGIPLVSFQSGYVRDEQNHLSRAQILAILTTEIKRLLARIQKEVRLVLEPEPGMFIETIEEAHELIAQVGDSRFGLHLDIGHVFCSEKNYIEAIRTHGKNALYMHMADIKEGFNLKLKTCSLTDAAELFTQEHPEEQATLYDIEDKGAFLFINQLDRFLIEYEPGLCSIELNIPASQTIVITESLVQSKMTQALNLELLAYLDSVSGVSYERALRAYKAVAVLRLGTKQRPALIRQVVCNTLRGKVHYHDLFGHGAIDYPAVLSAIIESGFHGYCTVELYNHAPLWLTIAPQSVKYLLAAMTSHYGWSLKDFGHIDHTTVSAPYIRLADAQMGPNGDCSILYDFRLCEPNTTALPPTTLHSLEHSLLAILPQVLPGFLMVAPMGCRTGLYITTAFPLQKNYVTQQLLIALEKICKLEAVPYQSEKTCGMVMDHDLKAAQAVAATVLKKLPTSTLQKISCGLY